jgi:hypothetical protein
MYLNPGVAMLDVVANTEPGGFGAISGMLAQLRGEEFNFGGGMQCNGNVCVPVDQFGNVVDAAAAGSGYWWPRVSLTFVGVSVLLTLASMRLVVPAGMRWAFARPRRRPAVVSPAPGVSVDTAAEGTPTIEELRSEPEPAEDPKP